MFSKEPVVTEQHAAGFQQAQYVAENSGLVVDMADHPAAVKMVEAGVFHRQRPRFGAAEFDPVRVTFGGHQFTAVLDQRRLDLKPYNPGAMVARKCDTAPASTGAQFQDPLPAKVYSLDDTRDIVFATGGDKAATPDEFDRGHPLCIVAILAIGIGCFRTIHAIAPRAGFGEQKRSDNENYGNCLNASQFRQPLISQNVAFADGKSVIWGTVYLMDSH